jgi:Glycosyl transferases group 1
MKIILGASLAIVPFSPGRAWHRLHYALGLEQLGHEVYFVEELDPESCRDTRGDKVGLEQSVNRELFRATLAPFGLMDRACLIYGRGEATFGLSREALTAVAREADLLLNWSGHITCDFVLEPVRRRVFMDQDPVLIQLWQEEYGMDFNLKRHDAFVSTGLSIGTPYTSVPDLGVRWHHVVPPVVLPYWPPRADPSCPRFTTVATLSPFGDVYYRGERYGTKHDALRRFAELPRKVTAQFEIAVKYYREEEPGLGFLRDNGWVVSDAAAIADLAGYQDYIRRSRGELGIVQSAQITARSGWFSDRWSHYLASAKPVLAQSTGFERWLPTGRGLLTFADMEEAVEGIERIERDYDAHCRAAREFAEEHLDHRKVLPAFLEACTAP